MTGDRLGRRSLVLDTLKRQGEHVPGAAQAVAAAERYFSRVEAIRAERYQVEREKELLAELATETATAIREAERAALLVIDQQEARELADVDRQLDAAAREGKHLSLADVEMIRTATTAGELEHLLDSAGRRGCATEARDLILPRVRVLAAREQRAGTQSGSAFRLWNQLTMNTRTGRPVEAVTARHEQLRRRAAQLVTQVLEVCELKRATPPAPKLEPQTQKTTFTVGAFWDRYPTLRR